MVVAAAYGYEVEVVELWGGEGGGWAGGVEEVCLEGLGVDFLTIVGIVGGEAFVVFLHHIWAYVQTYEFCGTPGEDGGYCAGATCVI